ncbi:hypothetical protein R3P38DRAFT_3182048 [Favolaschia claudopus]|uniref:F-box domain-containing protein n=1 Tax=Favolaschia claudopus TaxID=2862362 RepID=A0AAW0CFK2_9AGAR
MAPRRKASKSKQWAFPPGPNGFSSLPLDILWEIFHLLWPFELLQLSRITKAFRAYLLDPTNAGIWRSAWALCGPEFPECPPYASMPAWAHVVFEKICHVCNTNLRDDPEVDPVWWEFSARYCPGCVQSHVTKSISVKLKRLDPDYDWKNALRSVPRNQNRYDSLRYYLKADQAELVDACSDKGVIREIIKKNVDETRLIAEHSRVWRDWAENQITARLDAAAAKKEAKAKKKNEAENTRVEAIRIKLSALGWSDEQWMAGGTLAGQIRTYPSVVLSKVLTARAFRELQPTVVSRLNADKREHFLKSRIRVFLNDLWPQIITEVEMRLALRPPKVDIALIPAVRELLDQEGGADLDRDQVVNTLRPLMPQLLRERKEKILVQIRKQAGQVFDMNAESVDVLSLAIAFVSCPRNCGTVDHIQALLEHDCSPHYHWTDLNATSFLTLTGENEDKDPYQVAASNACYSKPFKLRVIDFESHLSVGKAVLEAFGRDWRTTTISDMRKEQRLIVCQLCGTKSTTEGHKLSKEPSPLGPMRWLAAMKHASKYHRRDGGKLTWKLTGKARS